METASFEQAIARLPRWILALAAAGSVLTAVFLGVRVAGGFLVGALGAYLNLWMIERVANRVTKPVTTAPSSGDKPGVGTGVGLLIAFTSLILGAFVILRVSGFNLTAAFCGFLVCPAAAVLEIVYELLTLNLHK